MFLISLNYPCPSLFRVLFAYVVFLVVSVVVRDLCASGCRQDFANFYLIARPLPPSLVTFYAPAHNFLSNRSNSYLKSVRA